MAHITSTPSPQNLPRSQPTTQITADLAVYADIKTYIPKLGDVIIKHGWFSRTKWFGVISSIDVDGNLYIIKDGNIKLLLTTPIAPKNKRGIILHATAVRAALPGTYAIMQLNLKAKCPIWYI